MFSFTSTATKLNWWVKLILRLVNSQHTLQLKEVVLWEIPW